jgi:L-ribulose-5-phosphate 3-epimerase
MRIGIMQGRLLPPQGAFQSFPRSGWDREFGLAARAELEGIEWIFDVGGADENPLATDSGCDRVRELAERHGVGVRSVCADYFMERPFLRCGAGQLAERLETLRWLLGRCRRLGASRIVLPFVDASRMETKQERWQVRDILGEILPDAEKAGVELHLETSLPPAQLRELCDSLEHSRLRVTYDSGNSASLGFRPEEEWAAYGDRVGSVHIKDRRLGGLTVPLGTGDADFAVLFDWMRRCGYDGDLILQASRGEPGDEVALAAANRSFVRRHLQPQ